MRVPFRPTLVLAALLASVAAQAAEAGPAVVVAQISGVPTSPGFKMTVNKGETGAPVATAVGARPIEKKDEKADEHGKAEHKSEAKAEKGEVHAEKTEKSEKSDKAATADKGEKPGKAEEPRTAEAKGGKEARPATGSMDDLRERLAAKLGARPAAGTRYAMQVSNRGESGENIITAVRPSAAAVGAARRARHGEAAASVPSGEANMDIAAHGGNALLPSHWDYAGAGGPESWASLKPEFAKCGNGTRQSPIDIKDGISVDLEPIKFDYRSSAFSVIDNGHTVQVNVEPGNSITITGRRYELLQFHFHRPSEERVNGRQYDMVVHLVHKDPEGKLAVVAVLLDRGAAQPLIQTVWNNLPLEKGEEVRAGARLDLPQLLPQDKRYYTYMGSLTTPPCSEGVLWMVMKQPVQVSEDQVGIFAHLYPMNARPIQQADGRLIKQSN